MKELATALILMTSKTKFGLIGGTSLLAIAFFMGRGIDGSDSLRPTPMPPVLEKVQALGELHTARYTYQNVFEHATALKTAEWARNIPGANSLVQSATRNRALVQVHGEVEAGIDLSKAKLGKQGSLVLPHAMVYRPQIDAKIYDVKRGLFWRDDNLALDAVRDAQIRLRVAAREQGIVAEAERNAVKQIHEIAPNSVVEFQ
ncbi:hypothetical protein BH11ARM1_BH11ARM1_09230 [soil metagenome]